MAVLSLMTDASSRTAKSCSLAKQTLAFAHGDVDTIQSWQPHLSEVSDFPSTEISMNPDFINETTWFVADWQLFLSTIEYGRVALVIDISRNQVIYIRFRIEETLDPSWIYSTLDRLSKQFGTPDALVTGQESLYPTLIIAGGRLDSPVTAELDPRISYNPAIRAYTKSLLRRHLRLSGSRKDAFAVNEELNLWRMQVNSGQFHIPQRAFTRGYYFGE